MDGWAKPCSAPMHVKENLHDGSYPTSRQLVDNAHPALMLFLPHQLVAEAWWCTGQLLLLCKYQIEMLEGWLDQDHSRVEQWDPHEHSSVWVQGQEIQHQHQEKLTILGGYVCINKLSAHGGRGVPAENSPGTHWVKHFSPSHGGVCQVLTLGTYPPSMHAARLFM